MSTWGEAQKALDDQMECVSVLLPGGYTPKIRTQRPIGISLSVVMMLAKLQRASSLQNSLGGWDDKQGFNTTVLGMRIDGVFCLDSIPTIF